MRTAAQIGVVGQEIGELRDQRDVVERQASCGNDFMKASRCLFRLMASVPLFGCDTMTPKTVTSQQELARIIRRFGRASSLLSRSSRSGQ